MSPGGVPAAFGGRETVLQVALAWLPQALVWPVCRFGYPCCVLEILVCLVLACLVGISVLIDVKVSRPRRAKRRAALAAEWERLLVLQRNNAGRGARLLQVVNPYQPARHGTKAIIVWCDTGVRQDAWFEGHRVFPGVFYLVAGQSGYGPHNNNPNVFYVNPQDVYLAAPAAAHAAWVELNTGSQA